MSDICTSTVVHEEAVEKARQSLPGSGEVESLGVFFKVLGDPTRLRILLALQTGELCVCDLSVTLNMTVSAISHQLSALRRARLVAGRRDGKVVYYRLDDHHVEAVLETAAIHVEER